MEKDHNKPRFNSVLSSKFNSKIIEPIKHLLNYQKIINHRLIFCINSGRSGSNYLAQLLSTAQEVTSYHEADPRMTGDYLRMINQQDYSSSFAKRKFKSSEIKNILLKLPDNQVYFESNHMFIKTFFDVVIPEFPKVEVIILRRYLPKVLKSFIELGYFSEKNQSWKFWMSSPNAVTAAIPCIDTDQNLDQWDLCIAYLIDIEARAIRFQQQYPQIKVHEIRLESLNNFSQVASFFEKINVTATEATKGVCSQQINQRTGVKKKYGGGEEVSLSYCRERIDLYIEKALALDIPIPKTLALDYEV